MCWFQKNNKALPFWFVWSRESPSWNSPLPSHDIHLSEAYGFCFFCSVSCVCLFLSEWCLMVSIDFCGCCPYGGLYSYSWTAKKSSPEGRMKDTSKKCLTKFYIGLSCLPQVTSNHYKHINWAVSVCCLQPSWLVLVVYGHFPPVLMIIITHTRTQALLLWYGHEGEDNLEL